MTLARLSNSETASRAMRVVGQSERTVNTGPNGIYIGKTEMYALPVFLDQSTLVNPHVAVLGMTGSGKTYLLNSMIAHMHLYLDADITVLDWNGEYARTVSNAGGTEYPVRQGEATVPEWLSFAPSVKTGMVTGIDLSGLRSKEREGFARRVLADIMEALPKHKADGRLRHIVFLDEAWKAMGSGELMSLFREGRKYGFAMVVATQMAGDIANEVIANAACMFVFKLQNSEDFSLLERSEVITGSDVARIAGLKVGACLLVEKRKHANGAASKVFIEKVHGIENYDYVALLGDGMRLDVRIDRFNRETDALCGNMETGNRITGFLEANSYNLDLGAFISRLMELRFGRAEIVTYLRGLGVDDVSIVSAYDEASAKRHEVIE